MYALLGCMVLYFHNYVSSLFYTLQIVFMCFTEQDVIVTVLAIFGKMCVSGSFNLLYVYMAEIMPTEVRSVGIGMCATFSRIIGMTAPFIGGNLVSTIHITYMIFFYIKSD